MAGPALASDVDILINKLAEKGILSRADAQEILQEIESESPAPVGAAPEIPSWLNRIKPFADLRIRHDTQWRDTATDSYDRNRERFRLRFGAKLETSENTEVGIRLASGSGFQNTTNQSFDEHSRGKGIFIDRAYAKWKQSDHLTLVGGKHKNPLFTTPLVWDPDVNPEGVSELLSLGLSENVDIHANLGQWFVEELNITNGDSDSDPTLLAFQLVSNVKPAENTAVRFGATYYDFQHMENLSWSSGVLSDSEDFLGYNQRHGQQMVFDSRGKLLNEWKCLELAAEIKFKDLLPVPFSIMGDYIKNFDADVSELIAKGVDPGDSDPADLLAYGGDDRDTGWLVGVTLGNKKKEGDWYFKYHYQELEDYAFPAVFVDSDFHGGGTNNEGHYIHGRYFLTDNIVAAATGFLTEREDEDKDGKRDEDRIQLDVIFSFP
jgi:hypothetical protein